MRFSGRARSGERGQVLIIFAVTMSLVFIVAAVAVDYSKWLSDRRGVARASDMAAAAGARDLPVAPSFAGGSPYEDASQCDTDACEAAFRWADRNGYGDAPDTSVRVYFYCANTIPVQRTDICFNEGQNTPIGMSHCGELELCDTINVQIETDAISLFSQFFGGVDFQIAFSSWGNIAARITALDAVMSIDASGSMEQGCGTPGEVCPIEQARIAADSFTTILFGDDPDDGNVQIGYAPYMGCYDPPDAGNCVPSLDLDECDNQGAWPGSWVACLGKDAGLLRDKFAITDPEHQTNICLGLYMSNEILQEPSTRNNDPETQRFAVILTDGENAFDASTSTGQCIPSDTAGGGGDTCADGPSASEAGLDDETLDMARDMENDGIVVYVIGFRVCGDDDGQVRGSGYCSGVGNGAADNVANQRLLKCIASSSPGTNDHYYETDNAIELGNIFRDVAYTIAGTGLIQGDD